MRPLTLVGGAAAALAARAALRAARARDLRGRTALVTGGSRGLGFALAAELARAGARVAICARGEEALERARERLAAQGAEVLATSCDVSRREEVEAWVAEATERLGPVDVLVNNAGVISVGPLLAQRLEDFAQAMDTHFWGIVHPVYAVLPQMLERGEGTIANVTSVGGKVSVPRLASYTPSKFAAVGLSQGLHAELAGHGITVVTVVPGLMRTGSHLSALFKGDRALEYALFSPVASSPLNTISAGRAARRIVRAIRLGETEVTLTLHARLLARAAGVVPGLTTEALAVVNRVLPDSSDPRRVRGDRIESPVDDSFLTALGSRAARAYNQRPD
jgi:NAD(P)-dependent dehydrogenase (short-subunit alcohol dehydrogenase family)